VYNLFQLMSSMPGGVGAASGYLYLKPGTLFTTSGIGSIGLDGGIEAGLGVAAAWESFTTFVDSSELFAYDEDS